jgi:Domain of unknown function (DUF4398)
MKTARKRSYPALILVFLVSSLFAFGCAAKVAPVESMTGAAMAIKEAENANAGVYAPLELRLAEEKLNAAKQAMAREDYTEAQRLSDEALADAQLAEAKSRAEKSKVTAEEMRESIETLRHEIERMQKQ